MGRDRERWRKLHSLSDRELRNTPVFRAGWPCADGRVGRLETRRALSLLMIVAPYFAPLVFGRDAHTHQLDFAHVFSALAGSLKLSVLDQDIGVSFDFVFFACARS